MSWLILLLSSAAAFLFLLVNTVQTYYSRPVVLHVRERMEGAVRFPAVTICNQNSFRYMFSGSRSMYSKVFSSPALGTTWVTWWWYHSLTAHQHQKGHTVPKQVIMIATSIQVVHGLLPPSLSTAIIIFLNSFPCTCIYVLYHSGSKCS